MSKINADLDETKIILVSYCKIIVNSSLLMLAIVLDLQNFIEPKLGEKDFS